MHARTQTGTFTRAKYMEPTDTRLWEQRNRSQLIEHNIYNHPYNAYTQNNNNNNNNSQVIAQLTSLSDSPKQHAVAAAVTSGGRLEAMNVRDSSISRRTDVWSIFPKFTHIKTHVFSPVRISKGSLPGSPLSASGTVDVLKLSHCLLVQVDKPPPPHTHTNCTWIISDQVKLINTGARGTYSCVCVSP